MKERKFELLVVIVAIELVGLCIAFSSSTMAEWGNRIFWFGIGVGIGAVFSLILLILADKCPRYVTGKYANTTVTWTGIPLRIFIWAIKGHSGVTSPLSFKAPESLTARTATGAATLLFQYSSRITGHCR